MTEQMFYRIAAFIFGACIGSFVNVCIYRLPRNESVVSPPSRCPYCRSRINFYDNIPLFSYMMLLGKCRHCGVYIPFRYFTVELMTAVASVLLFIEYGFGPLYVVYFFFAASLIAVTFIDLKHRIIPNEISVSGIIIGLVLSIILSYPGSAWPVDFRGSVIGAIAGGGALLSVGFLYSAITGREGIGLGDVKLTAMFGAFFGWRGAFFAILLGSILGLMVSLPVIIAKRSSLKYPIPFGPFLAAGVAVYAWIAKSFLDGFLPYW